MATIHIDREGKLTLPREIRQALGITGDDLLEITVTDGLAVLEPYCNNQPIEEELSWLQAL